MPRLPASIASLLLALVLLALHANCLNNSFHYDDGHSVVRNPHIRSLANLPSFFSDSRTFSANPAYAMYRPVVVSTLALNYAVGGYAPQGYLLLNIGLHIAVAILVLLVGGQLGLPTWAALGGALFFGLHPLQTEVVNYVSSRSESLAALFFLLSFLSFLHHTKSSNRNWLILSIAAFALALGSKATAITLPGILLLHTWLLSRHDLSARYLQHLPYWLLASGYLAFYALGTSSLSAPGQVRPLSAQLSTQVKAISYYLKKAFMPIDLSVYPQFFSESNLLAPPALLSALVLASLFAALVFLWRTQRRFTCFCTLWFAFSLSPTLIVPLHILVNDHRLYLPLVGLALLVGWALKNSGTRLVLPAAVVLLLFAALSYQRDQDWRSELTLWQAAAAQGPLVPEAHFNLGYAYQQAGQLLEARQAYQRAAALSPNYARAQTNLGVLLRQEGRQQEALTAFAKALQAEPTAIEPLNNMALIYRDLGQLNQAAELYQRGLESRPDLAELWFNLGLVYRDLGRGPQAVQALSRAARLDPTIKNRFPLQ